jgi:hypothetical protein
VSAIGSILLISSPYDTVVLVLKRAGLDDEAGRLRPLEVTCELHDLPDDSLVAVKDALRYWGITWTTLSY